MSSRAGLLRRLLISDRRLLSARRRSLDAGVGAVARRAFGGLRASATRRARRSRTSSRLRSWERYRSLDRRRVPVESIRVRSAARTLLRWRGPTARELATFQATSTRVAALFACCPPGPPDVLKDRRSSAPGIISDRLTRTSSTAIRAVQQARPDRPRESCRCRFGTRRRLPGR
jgi:hypothetical protein